MQGVEKNRACQAGLREFPWLIAHRGAMAEAPENGQTAFDLAFFHGADGIELDVQLSADHVPVVFHDDTLERTAGTKGRVSGLTKAQLKKLDVGKWFSSRYAGSRIMTLTEVLGRYTNQGILMIELKTVGRGPTSRNGPHLLVRKVAEQIFDCVPEDRRGHVFILSFDGVMLADMHKIAPGLCCMLNIHGPWPFSPYPGPELRRLAWGYCLPFGRTTRKFVRMCHETGKAVAVYSCNRPDQARRARAMGVDVIMTDAPAAVMPCFEKMR